MRYCPNCTIDYDDDVDECVECGGPLVEGSARETFEEVGDEDWVELDPLPGLAFAKLVKEQLEEEGIPCLIEALYGASSLETGYYGSQATLLVPDEHFDRALEVQQGMAPPGDDDLLIDPDADDY
ncbi:MAG: DUF2007 domain-containing protein [bacterium]